VLLRAKHRERQQPMMQTRRGTRGGDAGGVG
jgi:hypothetical protein